MTKSTKNMRVCIIGAGPSGMSMLYHLDKLHKEGHDIPEIVCYEKQDDFGGLWNYTWRTGTDHTGELVHGSMYRYLWSNGPKEALEFPDYTFEDHFGKAIPSFPPREVLFDYLKGRWNKSNLKRWITFNSVVKDVTYNDASEDFTVVVKNVLEGRVMTPETFDYVLVASGHFSVPNIPYFPGVENFPGRVMHAHDFRDAREFMGKRLLCIGSSYSAEDIALQCVKYGAKSVTCTYRTKPMGFNWPKNIRERPLLQKIVGKTCHFKDGSVADVDAIIFCTGYLHTYEFLEEKLRLKSPNIYYPPNLYKGTIWLKGGNNKCLYIGKQDQYYTFTMFDAQAAWAAKYLLGKITLPDKLTMEGDWKKWFERQKTLKDCYDEIKFQTDFVLDLAKEADYGHDLDVTQIFNDWEDDKHKDILSYRDKSFASKFTGTKSPIHHSIFMEALDDSMATFLATKN